MKKIKMALLVSSTFALPLYATLSPEVACQFDSSKSCTLVLDLLNAKSVDGLYYFAPTNYDHRVSGEINVYDATKVNRNNSGLLVQADRINPGFWRSGEIMTRSYLTSPPWNAPTPSAVWTTKQSTHGYLEVSLDMPKCIESDDGRCQAGTNPVEYNRGLWPAIWMMPTMGANWPQNGELDIMEAYSAYTNFDTTTGALHFNGNDAQCGGSDCVGQGYALTQTKFPQPAFNQPHTWGFEWQKDAQSTNNGYLMTGFVDNVKQWGPIRTDTLPADGANAMRRAFNDPDGGLYLIVNLAVGGPYSGPPHPQLKTSSMTIRAMNIYNINTNTPSVTNCSPPLNINNGYTADKKSITLNWQAPSDGSKVINYQIKDWSKKLLWQGSQLNWTDKTLPGVSGNYTYLLSSVCADKSSSDLSYSVTIPELVQCNMPLNVTTAYSSDKKSSTLKWNPPATGLNVTSYQVKNWLKQVIWEGNTLTWTDKTLPGTNGTFTYSINSKCTNTQSSSSSVDVIIK